MTISQAIKKSVEGGYRKEFGGIRPKEKKSELGTLKCIISLNT